MFRLVKDKFSRTDEWAPYIKITILLRFFRARFNYKEETVKIPRDRHP
jgi:hypothetical protein